MSLGLYIHVPFCRSKCAYCDFYSFCPDSFQAEEYTSRIIEDLNNWAARVNRAADTLYFGGGTPSLLGGANIARVVAAARQNFGLEEAEITVECNPGDALFEDFKIMAEAGVNRISIGAQSGKDNELKLLSRRHSAEQICQTVADAVKAGISNISLDVMLGIPEQTKKSLADTLAMFADLPITHISAYMLKVEAGTPMEKRVNELPDEDETAELYLEACRMLSDFGFERYEISNFCRDGKVSRHNVKYWQCEEYLGLGPSAHSFLGGKRFYYPRSYEDYMLGTTPIDDGFGGDPAERLMLALRLSEGIEPGSFCAKNNPDSKQKLQAEMDNLVKMGLMQKKGERYCFTDSGALVSNSCILRLTDLL